MSFSSGSSGFGAGSGSGSGAGGGVDPALQQFITMETEKQKLQVRTEFNGLNIKY